MKINEKWGKSPHAHTYTSEENESKGLFGREEELKSVRLRKKKQRANTGSFPVAVENQLSFVVKYRTLASQLHPLTDTSSGHHRARSGWLLIDTSARTMKVSLVVRVSSSSSRWSSILVSGYFYEWVIMKKKRIPRRTCECTDQGNADSAEADNLVFTRHAKALLLLLKFLQTTLKNPVGCCHGNSC